MFFFYSYIFETLSNNPLLPRTQCKKQNNNNYTVHFIVSLHIMKQKYINPLMYSAFAIELSDLSKPFKFARLKGFERLENCLTKGT